MRPLYFFKNLAFFIVETLHEELQKISLREKCPNTELFLVSI